MGASLTMCDHMKDDSGESRKLRWTFGKDLLPFVRASANSVPAAAVIQRMQALFVVTGRKASVDGQANHL